MLHFAMAGCIVYFSHITQDIKFLSWPLQHGSNNTHQNTKRYLHGTACFCNPALQISITATKKRRRKAGALVLPHFFALCCYINLKIFKNGIIWLAVHMQVIIRIQLHYLHGRSLNGLIYDTCRKKHALETLFLLPWKSECLLRQLQENEIKPYNYKQAKKVPPPDPDQQIRCSSAYTQDPLYQRHQSHLYHSTAELFSLTLNSQGLWMVKVLQMHKKKKN